MTRHAVIDLGSNTIRLVIYDVSAKALAAYREERKHDASGSIGKHDQERNQAKAAKLFTEILDEKKTVGLSAYVADGVFTQKGISKAAETLEEYLETAKAVNCKSRDIFATAVLRNCSNSEEAHAAIEEKIDHTVHLLSDKEEAHLGFVGAAFDTPIEFGTLIDIGGGSTELTAIRPDGDHRNISLPQGSVSSYAQFVSLILPTIDEVHAIEASMQEKLEQLEDLEAYRSPCVFGIGGSVRALMKLHAGLFGDGKKQQVISRAQIEAVLEALRNDPSTFAHQVTKSAPDRIHTVIPGTAIALCVMRAIGAEKLQVCKHGIREGYLLDRVLSV